MVGAVERESKPVGDGANAVEAEIDALRMQALEAREPVGQR